ATPHAPVEFHQNGFRPNVTIGASPICVLRGSLVATRKAAVAKAREVPHRQSTACWNRRVNEMKAQTICSLHIPATAIYIRHFLHSFSPPLRLRPAAPVR